MVSTDWLEMSPGQMSADWSKKTQTANMTSTLYKYVIIRHFKQKQAQLLFFLWDKQRKQNRCAECQFYLPAP